MADPTEYEGLTDEEIAELKAAESEGEHTGDEGEGGEESTEQVTEQDDGGQTEQTEQVAEQDEPAEGPTEVAPPLQARAPDDLKDRLDAIQARESDLQTRFDDGEITSAEFREGLGKLADEREGVRWEQRKAELANEMKTQAETNAWDRDVREFMSTTGASIAKSPTAIQAFDAHVRAVTSDMANTNLSNRQQLQKAYNAFVREISDLSTIAGLTKPMQQQPGKTPAQKPAAPQREIPPTLARVPAAEIEATDDGRWGALDRLASTDPVAYEKAVSKLTPAQQEEYANYGG